MIYTYNCLMVPPALSDPTLQGEIIEIIASSPSVADSAHPRMEPRHNRDLDVHCVLFDVYGTMFTSASGDVGTAQESSNADKFAEALRRGGFLVRDPAIGETVRREYFAEIDRRHAADRSRGIDFPEIDVADLWRMLLSKLLEEQAISPQANAHNEGAALRVAAWYEVLSNPVAPMPGIKETIAALRSTGRLLGIVSNAQFYTPLLFPALLGATHIELGFRQDLCVWSYQAGRAKPSTALFTPLLERLERAHGVAPASVVYVGNDMLNDVWTANKSGCKTALFAGDTRSLRLRQNDPRCAELRADVVILELPDLVDALGLAPSQREEGSTE